MYFEKIFRPTPEDERRDSFLYYKRTFWLSLLTGVLLFLPFLIESKGVFLYFGDYNAQQIPFYEHCVQMVHDGNFGWDWMTDLGSNFIGSYSYYLLGSPYFWFMCLFPATWAPYLMAPMFVAKFVTAALFVAGAWIMFSPYEPAFLLYAAGYLILGLISMGVTCLITGKTKT